MKLEFLLFRVLDKSGFGTFIVQWNAEIWMRSDFGQSTLVWEQFSWNVQKVQNPKEIVRVSDKNLRLKSECIVQTDRLLFPFIHKST